MANVKYLAGYGHMKWMLTQTPDDGCLLVFNANYGSWRKAASEQGLKLRVAKPLHSKKGVRTTHDTRDLYISK